MPLYNNKLGKFFSPSASYSGYVFIGVGIFAAFYSLLALILLIPGFFMAFTFNGTLIDTEKKRVKSYTSLFGFIKTGKWVNSDQFSGFRIVKATKNYTSYSRANVRFDMAISDIELQLTNRNGKNKLVLKKFTDYEDAKKEMENLRELRLIERQLFPLKFVE
jgi:hypothetical protein